jgi:hypothetical protein
MFLDPAARDLYRDWELMAESGLAGLRAVNGPSVEDPALAELVDELSASSEDFRRLWARHDARLLPSDVAHFNHPEVGELSLRYELLSLVGADGYVVVVYHEEPGSGSEPALARLKAMAYGLSAQRN